MEEGGEKREDQETRDLRNNMAVSFPHVSQSLAEEAGKQNMLMGTFNKQKACFL